MIDKARIKVIKKKDLKAAEKPKTKAEKPKQDTARRMVSNVSNWVSDFQKRKRDETKQAFEQLFPKQPQTESV